MDLQIELLNQSTNYEDFIRHYPEWEDCTLWFDKTPAELANVFHVAIASIFHTVEYVAQMERRNVRLRTAYYVQDYEPLFSPPGSVNHEKARHSYERIPDMHMFAKTDWICRQVRENHPGREISRVQPGLNWRMYNPFLISEVVDDGGVLKVVAMVRRSTPRRQLEQTLEVLRRLKEELSDLVEIHIFGCSDADLRYFGHLAAFPYINHGVLKPWEVAQLLAQCQLFLDMSTYQAFGRTGLEAMTYGCAAVMPREGGAGEFITSGENALLVNTLDNDEVVHAVTELLKDRPALTRMRSAGIQTARNYCTEKAAWSELMVLSQLPLE